MITANTEKPSNLAEVIGNVIDAFKELYGVAIPLQVGKQFKESFGAGSGPKILFVPEATGGKLDEPIQMGDAAASYVHACDVYVRAFEGTDDDLARFKNVYDLVDTLVGAIRAAATGRLSFGSVSDDSPTATNAYGAGIAFGFTYRRDIPHWTARWGGTTALASGLEIDPTVNAT